MVRILLGLISLTIFVGLMWGLRTILYGMGQDFTLGACFGIFLLMTLQWLYLKLCGKQIFDKLD